MAIIISFKPKCAWYMNISGPWDNEPKDKESSFHGIWQEICDRAETKMTDDSYLADNDWPSYEECWAQSADDLANCERSIHACWARNFEKSALKAIEDKISDAKAIA